MTRSVLSALVFGIGSALAMLLGWGITDAAAFFSHPARTALIVANSFMLFATLLIKDKFDVSFFKKGEEEVKMHRITIILPLITIVLLHLIAPYSDSNSFFVMDGDALRYLGLFSFFAGAILMTWAPLHLGRSFSFHVTIQKNHKLVTDGPYKYIRHPRYCGICLWFIGVTLVFRSSIGLLFGVLTAPVLLWRITDEEKLLHKHFRKKWEDYCSRTRRLIPFIY